MGQKTIGHIYKIVSPSGRVYIGQTINPELRLKNYQNNDCSSQPKLSRSIKKYGFNNHEFSIIETCSIKQMNDRERYYQDFYDVIKTGLNCMLTKSSDKSPIVSDITKQKQSIARKGKNLKPETIQKILKSREGYKHSEETKNKIAKALTGKILPKDVRDKMSKSNMGHSPHYCKKAVYSETGKIYDSGKQMALDLNINYFTLVSRLKDKNNLKFQWAA